jgi:hypothetical protein
MHLALIGIKKSFSMHNEIFIALIFKNSIGLLLAIAALGKMRGFRLFQTNLTDSFNVSPQLTALMSVIIILTELILAIFLLIGPSFLVVPSLYATFLLFLVFTLVVGQKLYTYQRVTCNCFGVSKEKLTYTDLMRNNIILLSCIIASYYYTPSNLNLWDTLALVLITLTMVICLLNFKNLTKTVLFKGQE